MCLQSIFAVWWLHTVHETPSNGKNGLVLSVKKIIKTFERLGLTIKIEVNRKAVNYLDITLNLSDGTYRPYLRPNSTPIYINVKSNHPPQVLKNVPLGINRRPCSVSRNEQAFDDAKPVYQDALEASGHATTLQFAGTNGASATTGRSGKRKRGHKIIWFTPPFSQSVKTNITWPEVCDRFMIWPWPAHANPQLSRTSPTSRTSTCTHHQLSSCSWAVTKKKSGVLFQGVDLEVTFFGIFFPSNPLRATSFFVCLRRLCLRRSPGVTQVLRLSLSHSLPLPSQIRAVSTFLLVWFVSKRVRESRGFVESKHELQRYWINNKLSSLTIDASTCMTIRKDSDWSEKSFPRQTNFENISLSRKRGILLG